ncbi:MAG: hypothetical protein QXH17_08690 [Candidatus Bathyarchaeia archaeon]
MLVVAVSYFAAVFLGQNIKLKMLVERIFLASKGSSEFQPFSIMQ